MFSMGLRNIMYDDMITLLLKSTHSLQDSFWTPILEVVEKLKIVIDIFECKFI